ncbi:MAG: hypothetical protein U0793_32015 [Gemmataceae bacterium]
MRCLSFVAFLACVGLLGVQGVASAQEAPPPVGVWKGNFDDGSGGITLVVTGGGVTVQVTGGAPVTGTWTWQATSRGGIITIHYYLAGRPNRLYYSVTYVDGRTMVFSDPWFRITLRRM